MSIEPNNTIGVVQQNKAEEAKMIEIVLPTHIKHKKVVHKEDSIKKLKLVGGFIEQQLEKCKIYLIIVRSLKSSSPQKRYKRRKIWIL